MEINRNNIYELTSKCNIKPDKDYGQNFLLEPSIAEKIVSELNLSKEDCVLEIGPGLGSLTHFLAGNCDLTVCDIDSRMIDFLKIFYKDSITYVLNDIRKVDVSGFKKIIGNLPYNITTELVTFLLLNAKSAEQMVLMCQLEAFDRFNELSGEKYGPTSILVHLLGEVKKILVVKPGSSRSPKPSVSHFSALISLASSRSHFSSSSSRISFISSPSISSHVATRQNSLFSGRYAATIAVSLVPS